MGNEREEPQRGRGKGAGDVREDEKGGEEKGSGGKGEQEGGVGGGRRQARRGLKSHRLQARCCRG